ncbi:MAG: AsmA family protein, partial [Usitatibacter sp.]
MTRTRRWVIAIVVVLLLPFVALGVLLIVAQSEWGERFIEARASAALERDVHIEGISIKLEWPPRIIFAKLRISNPPWAKTKDLIDAEGLYARVAVPPLFGGKVVIPSVGARHANAGLEIEGDKATWKFGKESKGESRMLLGMVYLDDGHIKFIDGGEKTDLDIDVKGSAGEGGAIEARGKGRFRGEAATAVATIPNLNPQHEAPLDLKGTATIGKTRADAQGTLTTDGKSLDLKFRLAGQNLKDFGGITRIVFPDSPPYDLSGRLRHQGGEWTFDPFAGKMGDSDLAGTATYVKTGAKPMFTAKLHSKVLDLNDLGPLIGAPPGTGAGETASADQKAQAAKREAANRVLPDQPFSTSAWGRMDADVTLEATRVQRPKQLPIDKLSTHLVLKDSVLKLQPLSFGIAEGRITSNITLDATKNPVRGDMKVDVQGLKLAPLFPTVDSMKDALGTLYGRAELVGHGTSVAQLLGTSDGKAAFAVDGGRLSSLLVELIGLDVAESILMLGRKHSQVQLRCMVAGFEAKGGVFTATDFVLDTDDTVV